MGQRWYSNGTESSPMKLLSGSVIVLALALAGCNHAAPVGAADNKNTPPAARADAPPVPSVPVVFTPETRNLISPEEVPLLEQINRENIKVVTATTPSIVRIAVAKPLDPHMQLFGGDLPFQFPFKPGQRRLYQPN